MVKTKQYAAQKWQAKVQAAASSDKWAKDVRGAPYCQNFQEFIGHSTPGACAALESGIQAAISANAWQTGVQGKEQAYIRGLDNVS